LFGGFDNQGRLVEEIYSFNFKLSAWSKVKCENFEGKAYCGTCSVMIPTQLYANKDYQAKITKEGIYIFGGMNASGICGTLAILNKYKTEHRFEIINADGIPPCPRYQHSMDYCGLLNVIVIYGGKNEGMLKCGANTTILNDMFVLSLDVMAWVKVEFNKDFTLEPKARHSTDIIGSILYIFGGINAQYNSSSTAFTVHLGKIIM
jgi:hypothetical protein